MNFRIHQRAADFSTARAKPIGLDFQEPMSGTATLDGKQVPVSFQLKAHIPDIDAWPNDPGRTAALSGTMTVGDRTVPVSGTLNLMEKADPSKGEVGHYLEYKLESPAGIEPPVRFAGTKHIQLSPGLDLPSELTTLRGNFVPPGVPLDGKKEAEHPSVELDFHWTNPLVMLPFLASFHATQGDQYSPAHDLEAIAKFAKVCGGEVLSDVFPFLQKDLGWNAG